MQVDARDAPYPAAWAPEAEEQPIAYTKGRREAVADTT